MILSRIFMDQTPIVAKSDWRVWAIGEGDR